jgi:hypothetical protein
MTVTVTAPLVAGDAPSGAVQAERAALASRRVADRTVPDIVDVWGRDSFPASDAPANW